MDSHGDKHQAPSNSELFSSAKVIAGAAQSTFSHESDKIDRAKVADAAGDLLGAASQYGKLDDKGLGKYVDKAEEYLHQYSSPGSKPAGSHGDAAFSEGGQGRTESHGDGGDHGRLGSDSGSNQSKPESHGEGGGGFGDYMKMAQGFLKKN